MKYNDLVKAVNSKNRTEINKEYKKIYDKYIDLLFYTAFRIVRQKEKAYKIACDSLLIIYKNIYLVEDILEELCYLVKENSLKFISSLDNLSDEYDLFLKEINVTDEELNLYISTYLYDRSLKNLYFDKLINKKLLKKKRELAIYKLNDIDIVSKLNYKHSYDDISSKIEMTPKTFFIKEKKLLWTGISFLILTVLLFLCALIIACIPSVSNTKVSEYMLYISAFGLTIGIICLFISSLINKHNKELWK